MLMHAALVVKGVLLIDSYLCWLLLVFILIAADSSPAPAGAAAAAAQLSTPGEAVSGTTSALHATAAGGTSRDTHGAGHTA